MVPRLLGRCQSLFQFALVHDQNHFAACRCPR